MSQPGPSGCWGKLEIYRGYHGDFSHDITGYSQQYDTNAE